MDKIVETESKRNVLARCQFCWSLDVVLVEQEVDGFPELDDVFFVRCKNCRAQGPDADSERTACERWNYAGAAMFRNVDVSMARLLRYTTIKSFYDNGDVSFREMSELLNGNIEPGNDDTHYDDSFVLGMLNSE